jgi:hypothetical protein
MKYKNLLFSSVLALVVSAPVFAQSPMNPWEPGYQNPYRAGQAQRPNGMSPEQMQEMQRQRHEAMMQRRAMKMQMQNQNQPSAMKGGGMDCQHGGMGKKGQQGAMKHGKKHGKMHDAHRKQMEQRLQRIESLLQQLVDQQSEQAKAE